MKERPSDTTMRESENRTAWESEIDIAQDPSVQQNWGNLFDLISQPQDEKTSNKEFIDQLVIELTYSWLERNDQCGVYQDFLDVAISSVASGTLDQLIGADLSGYLAPGNGDDGDEGKERDIKDDGDDENDRDKKDDGDDGDDEKDRDKKDDGDDGKDRDKKEPKGFQPTTETIEEPNDGGRSLQLFTENSCSTFESTIFLGSMLSFSSCAKVDIGKFFGTVEENMVNVGLNCLNTFLQPFQRTETCASRNFQNYVMDECVKGVVSDDILGHIFQLFLVSPKQTCGCMSSLASVPTCRVDVTQQISLDGMLTSKVACLLESQICSKLESECARRLDVLDQCLPDLENMNTNNFDCEEVSCNCEQSDKGLLNYAGKAMDLPMSDMCVDEAANNFVDDYIPERYASFQEKCGAQFIHELDPPSAAPTTSFAPSMSPTGEEDNLANLIQGQNANSPVNSVMSGILLALAITGVASIFLVFVLVLWRRRFRSKGRQVRTIDEMKTHAQEQIRKLEEDVKRMEEQQHHLSGNEGSSSRDF